MTSPTPPGVPPGSPAIHVSGLTKRFGDVEALRGIDLDVAPGTVLGLLGPNGAGKTTAVRILTTILQADGGRAEVLGIDVTSDPRSARAAIGLAGQYAAVDENLTGRENLRLVGRLTHLRRAAVAGRAAELLDQFGLTDAADRPAKTYSGGMRRRLDLAAALVHRPPVLFLDEPTTGLDPASRSDLWHVIDELVADGTTVLLTTQYLEEADRLADRIAVIDRAGSSPRARPPSSRRSSAARSCTSRSPTPPRRSEPPPSSATTTPSRPPSTAATSTSPSTTGPARSSPSCARSTAPASIPRA